LEPAVKKVSIAIIVILLLTIGGFWYADHKPNSSQTTKNSTDSSASSPSPEAIINIQAYTTGRDQIDRAISTELAKTGTTSSRALQTAKPYTNNNLIISYNISPTALRAYGLKVVEALKPLDNKNEGAIAIMLDILQTGDRSQVQKITDQAMATKKALADLLKISTPKTASTVHLALITALSRNSATLSDMTTILDHPSIALQAADLYRVQSLDFLKAVNRLNQFFRDNNIVFTSEESGTVYTN